MKNRLIQLSKGTIEYRVPAVSLDTDILTGTVLPGRRLTMDVNVVSRNGYSMHLFFYSTNPRITVSQPLSIGKTGKFTVQINAKGLAMFDTIEGHIDIVYNGGEIVLPYVFTVGFVKEFRTDMDLTTLEGFFDFTNAHRDEAEKLFSWNDFLNLPFMQDLHLYALYQTYYSGTKKDAGLSEFLKAAGYEQKYPPVPRARAAEGRKQAGPLTVPQREHRGMYRAEEYYLEYRRILEGDGAGQEELLKKAAALASGPDGSAGANLLYAFLAIRNRKDKKAREALIRAQDRVQKERLKRKDLYCLFQYLAAELSGEAGERENAEALAHRYFAEGTDSPLLYLMEFCLDPANASDAFRAQAFLKDAYAHDIRAAWVLQEAAYLWMKGGVEIPLLTGFELKATLYGIRKGILTEQKVFEILSAEMTDPKLLNLYMTVLKTGFLRYGNREFLQAIVNVYMQQKAADTVSLPWYRAAVSEELSIPGLYEYYLASLPKDSTDPIPEHMIRYFGMGSTAAGTSYAVLYLNVLKYYREDEEILGMYDRRIREYAYRRLKREEFARHELPLYVYILEKEGVTQENALYLKPLFYLTEVRTGEARASRVVLHYPELSRETSFPLVQGKALFPVYTREAVIALENSRGNRIADPRLQAEKVFDYPEYRRQCALLTPPTILQKLSDIEEKALAGNVRDSDVILLTDLIKDRNLNPFFRDRLYEMLIDMNERRELSHMDCTQFLMEADPSAFRRPYLLKLTGLLVSKGYYRVAYQRVMDYGPEGIPGDTLYELAVRMLGEPVLEGSETLKCLLYMLSESGRADGRILDYLARYFNGTSAQMEKLSKAVRRKRVPSYDLYERTLTVCFYTGKDRDIDTLFGWYVGQNMQNETLRHAYLVYRAHTYFKHGKKLTDVAAEALKKEAAGLPDVCLMACLTWLAEHADSLTEDDKALAEDLLCRAVRKNIFLGCFEKFENTVKIPAEMEGRVYLEYRSDTAKEVSVIGQILPERHYFHGAMKPVYPGVYVRTFILYPREWIQFYYNVREEDGSVSETEGPLVFRDEVKAAPGSLYDDVLATEEKLSAGDPAGTAAYLRDLVAKRKMIDHLFTEDT